MTGIGVHVTKSHNYAWRIQINVGVLYIYTQMFSATGIITVGTGENICIKYKEVVPLFA